MFKIQIPNVRSPGWISKDRLGAGKRTFFSTILTFFFVTSYKAHFAIYSSCALTGARLLSR